MLRQAAASEPRHELEALLDRIDGLLRPLAPGTSAGRFSAMSAATTTDAARVLLKCLIKAIVCNRVEADSLGRSPRVLEVVARYLGSDEIFFEHGSLRLHLCQDRLEVLQFHVDKAESSDFRMLNCWIPMSRVLPGQEIRVVPLSHRIGARGRRLFEALPERVKLLCSTGLADYAPGDVHLWSGDTEHGRVLNRHVDPAIAMVFRYAGRPLNPDWRRADPRAGGEQAAASPAANLDELMRTLIREAIELIQSSPQFAPSDSLRLLHSEHLVSHPGIGRQLALWLHYYYERSGLGYQAMVKGAETTESGPAHWPEYMIEIYLRLGLSYVQQGDPDKAQRLLAEAIRRTASDDALLDKVARLRSPALVKAMIEVHGALGMGDRAARFAALLRKPVEAHKAT